MTYAEDGSLTLGTAADWSVSNDGLIYKFSLRTNARWSDGKQVTASDFVRGFQRVIDPRTASPWAGELNFIENAVEIMDGSVGPQNLGVVAIGDNDLEIRLERPVSYFLELLAHPSTYPYRARIEESGSNDGSGDPFGTVNGPFVLSARKTGSSISLVKNNFYWDAENVWCDAVTYHIHTPSAEVLRFRAGELDITSSVDPASFPLLKREMKTELRVYPSLNVYFYGFNLTQEPFRGNRDLRRALALAIDRDKLVSAVTRRGEVPAYSFVPPNVANYKPKMPDYAALTQSQRNELATRLFENAQRSGPKLKTINLRFNSGGGHEPIAIAVQSMWRQVLSVEAELQSEEFKVFIDNLRVQRGIEVFRLSWKADYNDAASFLRLFHSSNPNNFTGFVDEEVDALLDAAAQTDDAVRRLELLQSVESKILEEQVIIPIYFFVNKHLVNPEVEGWKNNVSDIHLSKYLKLRGRSKARRD